MSERPTAPTHEDDAGHPWAGYPVGMRDTVLGIIGRVVVHLAENGRHNADVLAGRITAEEAARAISLDRARLERAIAGKIRDCARHDERGRPLAPVDWAFCADCGRAVTLVDDWPVDGVVARGNPSGILCRACAAHHGAEPATDPRQPWTTKGTGTL